MRCWSSRGASLKAGFMVAAVALLGMALGAACSKAPQQGAPTSSKLQGSIPNNHLLPNPGGEAATVSTRGSVDLTGEFFQTQGKNGQSCASCHIPEEAWSITPATLQRLFDETNGTHPVFSALDANNPNMDVSTE